MLRSLLAAAPLVALASAFSGTHPIVAWSSHRTAVLDRLSAVPAGLDDIFAHALSNDDVCDYDAVVLVEQPGLHASDLRTLAPASRFADILASAPASVQLPYIRRSTSQGDSGSLHDLAHLVTHRCQARLASVVPGESDLVLEPASKHVINVYLPELDGGVAERKAAAAKSTHALLQELPKITAALPKHLVIFTGVSPSAHARRQLTAATGTDSPVLEQQPSQPPAATFTPPAGGVLARYQLLTPGLITALLIALFVLLPALVFAISALASIQSPLRVEAPKGFNAHEKKVQ